MSQQGPMPVFLKTGFSETDSALEDMAREMAKQLRQGLAKLERYQNFSDLPVCVAMLPEELRGEHYVFVIAGYLCRVADLERFTTAEVLPCIVRMVGNSIRPMILLRIEHFEGWLEGQIIFGIDIRQARGLPGALSRATRGLPGADSALEDMARESLQRATRCVFRAIVGTNSGTSWAVIPDHSGMRKIDFEPSAPKNCTRI
jgi:hypothetical protein